MAIHDLDELDVGPHDLGNLILTNGVDGHW